jgi:hypothetical protein
MHVSNWRRAFNPSSVNKGARMQISFRNLLNHASSPTRISAILKEHRECDQQTLFANKSR